MQANEASAFHRYLKVSAMRRSPFLDPYSHFPKIFPKFSLTFVANPELPEYLVLLDSFIRLKDEAQASLKTHRNPHELVPSQPETPFFLP